jgi:hypothetical protein
VFGIAVTIQNNSLGWALPLMDDLEDEGPEILLGSDL